MFLLIQSSITTTENDWISQYKRSSCLPQPILNSNSIKNNLMEKKVANIRQKKV